MLSRLARFLLTLPAVQAAICHNGCSGHGSCGLLGTCICEGSWAGRDCSFQLSLDSELPDATVAAPATPFAHADPLDSAALVFGMESQGRPLAAERAKPSAASFAESRRAAENAWAAADKLFAAARMENERDAAERLERAVGKARSKKEAIPGHEFAGLQAATAAKTGGCNMDCSSQGICLAGKCLCRDGYYGQTCEHKRCLNDCSGNGQCLSGQCRCSEKFGGEDCSQLLQTQTSLASILSRGLAAEKEQLARQSEEKKEKACPLNCDSHGDCHDGTCMCRDGWTGPACQDYMRPMAPLTLTQAVKKACASPNCSGNGVCQFGQCKCQQGFRGEACELPEAFMAVKPLQLQLQQVSAEDERLAQTCLGGCGHGKCQAGMCECDAGWQGTSCNIDVEAALRSQSADEEIALARVPTAGSWISPAARVPAGKALRASLQQEQAAERSKGGTAASTLNSWLKTASAVQSSHPVDGLASLLKAAIAAPQD